MEENNRIPEELLPASFADGDILTNLDVNKIIDVLRTGVNANYQDINTGNTNITNISNRIKDGTFSKASEGTLQNSDTVFPSSRQIKNYVDNIVATKQPLLEAGENITIENNVISASGGGGGITGITVITDEMIPADNTKLSWFAVTYGDGLYVVDDNFTNTSWKLIAGGSGSNSISTFLTPKTYILISNSGRVIMTTQGGQTQWYAGFRLYVTKTESVTTTSEYHYFAYSLSDYLYSASKLNTVLDNLFKNLYIPRNNTTAFTPTGDYNPATKIYVDTAISNAISSSITTVLEGDY